MSAGSCEPPAEAGLTGKAVVEVTIDRNGVPQDLKFIGFYAAGAANSVKVDPLGLDKSAIAAVRKWRFVPARKNFDSIPARATVVVTFPGPE